MRAKLTGVLLAGLLATAACSQSPGTDTASSGSAGGGDHWNITVATGVDATFAPLLAAVKQNFFQQQGITAKLSVFAAGNDALNAVSTGNAQVSCSSELGGVVAFGKGVDIHPIGLASWSGHQLGVVSIDSIKSPTDLYGHKVGFPIGGGGDLLFNLYADKYHLDKSKITQVNLQTPDAVAAMANHDIDALFLFEPSLTKTVQTVPHTHILTYSGDLLPASCYVYLPGKVLANTAETTAIIKAIQAGSKWLMDNPTEAQSLLVQNYHLSTQDAATAIKYFGFGLRWTQGEQDRVEKAADLALQRKLVPAPVDLSKYLRVDALKAVDASAVTATG
jgi:ABC-type nitrate/sulfonate/bicarbonate transport system substrate-binding protein